MSGIPGADAEAAAIHAAFAEQVVYTGGGLSAATVDAVVSDGAGEAFLGPGGSARMRTFEIREAAFSSAPANENTAVDGEGTWYVIDVTRRRDVDAYVLTAELR